MVGFLLEYKGSVWAVQHFLSKVQKSSYYYDTYDKNSSIRLTVGLLHSRPACMPGGLVERISGGVNFTIAHNCVVPLCTAQHTG